ncbi:MAG: DUF1800 domain-containing protein [Pseudoclavibacter sp.]|nr:DUF1800 domain-containing protein [Pseudoclavibacter sp.]
MASLLADAPAEQASATPSQNGRRALIVGGAAAAGLAAFGLGGRLLGWFGGGAGPEAGSGGVGGGPGSGSGGRPGPGQEGPGGAPGAAARPEGTAKPGSGAPQTPVELSPTSDRDQSYAASQSEATPVSAGFDPQLPPGRTVGAVSVPVADSPEARRHLLQRAGYGVGAKAEAEIEAAGLDAWLAQQLDPTMPDPADGLVRSWFPLSAADIPTTRGSIKEYSWDGMYEVSSATLARQMFSSRQIYEVVVDVMSNLLHVTIPSEFAWDSSADYANTVIRANAFGSYRDMLLASARHPAMLRYLNNTESVDGTINENYGRELLELHTVGVDGGYTEDDVKAAAVILSGRRVDPKTGAFVYQPEHHATGQVKVLDFSDPNADANAGLELGDRYVAYLAGLPQTARTVARKLAVRFISDSPSEASVEHLAQVYLQNDTQLLPVLTELFRLEEFWRTSGSKVRRPLEDVVGSVRAIDVRPEACNAKAITELRYEIGVMGHAPLGWVPPNGYPDVASAWMSASQLIRRWNLHRVLVNGWREGFEPSDEFNRAMVPAPGSTVDQWIESVCALTVGGPPSDQIRQASYAFLNAGGADPADTPDMLRLAPHFVAVVLNSPSFAIR